MRHERGPRRRTAPAAMLVASLAVALVPVAWTPGAVIPRAEAATPGAGLSVSPKVFTGGQNLRWTGDIGVAGRRRLVLQSNMLRPGDTWHTVPGVRPVTDASGRFDFRFRAGSMYGVGYRLVSGALSTPVFVQNSHAQEIVLTVQGDPVEGRTLTVDADTTPTISGHSELPPPLLVGRGAALQERLGGTWTTRATASVGRDGHVRFPLSPAAGDHAYRVRLADWTEGGSRVGWFPSFPLELTVHRTYQDWQDAPTPPRTTSSRPSTASYPFPVGAAASSAVLYRWGAPRWEFDWERGESLGSHATNGRGRWVDSSEGSGRAAHENGGLGLESSLRYSGPGDHRSVSATLRGNARTYGRWEVRFRSKETETGAAPYRVRLELVPERVADRHCGAVGITVADIDVPTSSNRLSLNALAGDRRWSRTLTGLRFGREPHNYGVEVGRDHVTWLLDKRPVAVVRRSSAVPRVPLTLRYTLVGGGPAERNHTMTNMDWARSYGLGAGAQLRRAPTMRAGAHAPGC